MFKKALAGALVCLFTFSSVANADTVKDYADTLGDRFEALMSPNLQVVAVSRIPTGERLGPPYWGWEQKADGIIALGKTYRGTPYVYGAKRFDDKAFDCSSFVQLLFSKYGISLGSTSYEQAKQGVWVPLDQVRKGDLLFFEDPFSPNAGGASQAGHVGIYMGDGKILHTYKKGVGVTVSSMQDDPRSGDYWHDHILFAKRIHL